MQRDILISCDGVGDITPIIGGIVNQAIKDYRGRNKDLQDDAIHFFESEYCNFMCGLDGMYIMRKADDLKHYNEYLKRKGSIK